MCLFCIYIFTDDNGQLDSGESRIRVRNWLMLADQSIIDKTSDESTDKLTPSKKPNISAVKSTNNANAKPATTPATISTTPPATRTLNNSSNSNNTNNNSNNNNIVGEKTSSSCLPVLDPKTQTVTRIGSIGRTTIACITPASLKNSASNCNVDAASAAALAAAGVELDSIDDSMTEVIVKIENPENVSLNGDEAVCNEAIDDENTFDYDLKMASPLSWTYDAVKIENEEFEDSYLMDNDDDDDDLLTTAAATQKHAKQSNEKQRNGSSSNNNNSSSNKIVLSSQQQQQLLLEQQQHLQHLQLQPTSQSLQIKLPAIPATITTIAAPQKQPIASTSGGANITTANSTLLSSKLGLNMDAQNLNLHWSHTDDNRYRILVQNKRMRKESLEHSADMIYNADIEKPWVCRNCNRTYKWKNSLKCHLKNECGLPPRYFCSKMCGYATNVHSNLKRHLNTKCRDREKEEEEKEKEKEKERKLAPAPVNAMANSSSNTVGGNNNANSSNNNNNNNNNNNSSNSNSSTYTLVFQNE
ncbi:longitudinals lacking protein, isoforms J/P/Q/S/Z-like [Drosophila novamexicana]|uniref:longitudinals lacking protein, isoforms J/P/Q/S/Z-like n=1 Tax=Drosophila novamexicana TaxID=47314 RepID=UPI0011E5C013|nr:longitudinals lacking protein, isoforms J/P/Q/S/Z-like [Drosophila novamexicana]